MKKYKLKVLQHSGDFIIEMLNISRNNYEFNVWFMIGQMLDYWCVEREIYLN